MRQINVPETDTGMARLDPRMSRMKYRLERLMLTPLFRFSLRVVLPFALAFGGVTAWFSVEANRTAFTLMVADVQAAVQNRPEFQVKLMAIDGATEAVAEAIRAELALNLPMSSFDLDLDEMQLKAGALDAVKKVDLRAGKVTVIHEELKNLDMPAMTMVFRTADDAMLETLKEGAEIEFVADRVAGKLTIIELK